ncbi:hypothetical protein HK101_004273 [Irineochytrium annulatum]|nr:hypothetical protein HK101_004273 [Irineochytrium annulatum]
MYRAITFKALEKKVPLTSPEELTDLANDTKIAFEPVLGVDGAPPSLRVLLDDGMDITTQIRARGVTNYVHYIASVRGVREKLTSLQRELCVQLHWAGIVMEGRDIGSQVLPDAELKVYLDGDPRVRAERRLVELKGAYTGTIQELSKAQEIHERDEKDMRRTLSPLVKAERAVVIDTSYLTLEEQSSHEKNVKDNLHTSPFQKYSGSNSPHRPSTRDRGLHKTTTTGVDDEESTSTMITAEEHDAPLESLEFEKGAAPDGLHAQKMLAKAKMVQQTEDCVFEPMSGAVHPTRTIVMALDSSKYSDYAFSWAMKNLVQDNDQIVLVNVRPQIAPPSIADIYLSDVADTAAVDEANKRESHDLLRSYASKLPKDKYNVRGIALRGDAREEILQKVEEMNADMLVCGSRGLGFFSRALMGSVSDYLVHHAHCPVVVPKMPEDGSHRGTVRYVGPLPPDGPPDAVRYLGIEWDDASRGKHSGAFQSRSIFEVREPGSASFLKLPLVKPRTEPVSFLAALREKYAGSAEAVAEATAREAAMLLRQSSSIRGKTVEAVGWDAITRRLANLKSLREVVLSGKSIAVMKDEEEIGSAHAAAKAEGGTASPSGGFASRIRDTCPSVRELDLSRNLLRGWADAAMICRGMERLELLRLSHNRFVLGSELGTRVLAGAFSSLRVLALNHTMLRWKEVEAVAYAFPVLEEIHLGFNKLNDAGIESGLVEGAIAFGRLKLVNLEENKITSWAAAAALATTLPSLTTLHLTSNQIPTIDPRPPPTESGATPFSLLASLHIAHNQISSWGSIHNLNLYPNLREIRIRGNPVVTSSLDAASPNSVASGTSGAGGSDTVFELIARVRTLEVVNGTRVEVRDRKAGGMDRRNAELWYLARCAQDRASMEPTAFAERHPRFPELVGIYGDPAAPVVPAGTGGSNTLKDRMVELVLVEVGGRGREMKKRIPVGMTVRTFRTLVVRLFGVKAGTDVRMEAVAAGDGVERLMEMDDEMREVAYFDLKANDKVRVVRESKAIKSWFQEFKAFISKGNVVDLAVGVIIGGAFGAIVSSAVSDIISPYISLVTGNQLENAFYMLRPPNPELCKIKENPCTTFASPAEAQEYGAVTVNYGRFVQLCINFLMVSLLLFSVIHSYTRVREALRKQEVEKEEQAKAAPPPPPPSHRECPFCTSEIPKRAAKCMFCTSSVNPVGDAINVSSS